MPYLPLKGWVPHPLSGGHNALLCLFNCSCSFLVAIQAEWRCQIIWIVSLTVAIIQGQIHKLHTDTFYATVNMIFAVMCQYFSTSFNLEESINLGEISLQTATFLSMNKLVVWDLKCLQWRKCLLHWKSLNCHWNIFLTTSLSLEGHSGCSCSFLFISE